MARLLLALLLASLATAQEPARAAFAELIALAEKRLARQAPDEESMVLLWQAEDRLREAAADPARDAAAAALPALLARADPLPGPRAQAFAAVAKKMLELAQLYE